jgi:hypothetical protein
VKKRKSKEFNEATHKQVRGDFGGWTMCDPGWIPFGMVWEWSRVTCKACLSLRKR